MKLNQKRFSLKHMKPASNNMPITAIWWNFGPSKKQIMLQEGTKRFISGYVCLINEFN